MQNTMNNHAMQLGFEINSKLLRIVANAVQADEQIPGNMIVPTVIKRYNVCVIIVSQVLLIDLQEVIIGAKNQGNFIQGFTFLLCNAGKPFNKKIRGKPQIFNLFVVNIYHYARLKYMFTTRPPSSKIKSSARFLIRKIPRPFSFSMFSGAVGSGRLV